MGWKHLVKIPKRGREEGDQAYRLKKRGRVFHHVILIGKNGDLGFDFTCPQPPPEDSYDGIEERRKWEDLDKVLRCKTCSSILDAFDDYGRKVVEKKPEWMTDKEWRAIRWKVSPKFVAGVTYSNTWDGLNQKFSLYLDREQYENLRNEPPKKTKRGTKSGRWLVRPRSWVKGERRYRYFARGHSDEYFPSIEEKKGNFRRGAKASGMSFKIKKEIFRLIQAGDSKHIERLMKKYGYTICDLFPKRWVNAPESRRMIARLKKGDRPDDDELLEFSKKIWKTILSRLLDLQIRDRLGGKGAGGKKTDYGRPKKHFQFFGPDFSVVVWELLFKPNEEMEVSLQGKIKAAEVSMDFVNENRKKRGVHPYDSVTEYLLERNPKLLEEYRREG